MQLRTRLAINQLEKVHQELGNFNELNSSCTIESAITAAVEAIKNLETQLDEKRSVIQKLNNNLLEAIGIVHKYEDRIKELEADIILMQNSVLQGGEI